MLKMIELDRYLENLKEGALRQMIRSFMKDPEGTQKFVQKQIDEFNKMYPEGDN